MGRRSPESMVKRAREQALREKRELKQAKKDARAAARLNPAGDETDVPDSLNEADHADESEEPDGKPDVTGELPAA